MDSGATPNKAWWGTSDVPVGDEREWHIGPLRLRVAHLRGGWRVRHRNGDDPLEDTVRLSEPQHSIGDDHEDDTILRFAKLGESDQVTVRPALADRPIVSHPIEPFFVLPGDEARVFVSTPLWLKLGIEPDADLFEFPILRPSDSWTGPTTGGGSRAYSSRTSCRLTLADLPFRPHRSLTLVCIRNRAEEPLRLDRIAVAVPHLSLFASAQGRLWTESITLTREADEDEVDVEIADQPAPEALATEPIASPRKPLAGNRLQSAFDALF